MNSIEALENISITFDEGGYSPTTFGGKEGHFIEVFGDDFRIIEKDLERLEKLEKVIDILKDKIQFEDLGEMQSGNIYRGYFNDCFNEEEYELLKEVLGNDN